ncbi:MAG TPA: adenylate cyclase regulatory domain-containing protein, partial [Solirubrobacteraceae bacterium]|nr:adenylate cyclase regulatory domain-containing protein [Solirubrobacteraceae bacterium]
YAAEGLLKGLRGKQREARLDLLRQLHEAGVPLEELKKAAGEDRLALLPVEMVLQREGRYSARDIAEATGQDEGAMRRQRQALGLPWVADPDAKVFTEDDLEAARRARAFAGAGFPEEATLEVSRVIGEAMSRVAGAIRNLVGERLLRPGDTERDLGLRYAEVARETAPLLGPVLEYVLNQHLVEQIRDDVISRAELQAGEILPDAREMAVCFADLSGFTRLGEVAAVEELGVVAGRLAAIASEVAGGPVRLVKTIGDAAMLVSPEPAALVEAALALVDAAEAEGENFPQLHAGVALGPVVSRGGDWYGHTVNLASRIAAIAWPGSVLCDDAVHDAAPDSFRWSFAGERRLKGVKKPVRLWRARRLADDDAAS